MPLSRSPSLISAMMAVAVSESAAPADRNPMRTGAFCAPAANGRASVNIEKVVPLSPIYNHPLARGKCWTSYHVEVAQTGCDRGTSDIGGRTQRLVVPSDPRRCRASERGTAEGGRVAPSAAATGATPELLQTKCLPALANRVHASVLPFVIRSIRRG